MTELDGDLDFATLAIAHKFLTHEQIEEAQALLADGKTEATTIEEVLQERGVLTEQEVWAVYKAQERLRKDAKSVGRKIGGYEIVGKLGEGGLGVVYKARQLSMGRIIALKVLHEKWVGDDEFRKRFLVEARLVGRLSHQNLIQVFDVGRYRTTLYYSMEFIDGETVEDKIDREGPMDVLEAADIIGQVARALQYLQTKKIVHRDVKPGNVMVTRYGVAKLGDFGFVKSSLDSVLSPEGEVLGTPDYISPEAARGEGNLDFRSDMYSLGASLYHMLAGRPPFGGSGSSVMEAHIQKPLPALKTVNPDVPMRAAQIVGRLMAKNPEDRYDAYTDLFEDLDRLRLELSQAGKAMRRNTGVRAPDSQTERIDSLREREKKLSNLIKILTISNIATGIGFLAVLLYLLLRGD